MGVCGEAAWDCCGEAARHCAANLRGIAWPSCVAAVGGRGKRCSRGCVAGLGVPGLALPPPTCKAPGVPPCRHVRRNRCVLLLPVQHDLRPAAGAGRCAPRCDPCFGWLQVAMLSCRVRCGRLQAAMRTRRCRCKSYGPSWLESSCTLLSHLPMAPAPPTLQLPNRRAAAASWEAHGPVLPAQPHS